MLVRYLAIHKAIKFHHRPSLEDILIYVNERTSYQISKRQLQLDIQEMRFNQDLGFEAPILAVRGHRPAHSHKQTWFYIYEDPNYSIIEAIKKKLESI